MRRYLGFSLAALVVCLMAGNEAMAQGGRGGRGGFGGGFGGGVTFLVQNEQVQKELKITDEQKTKLKEIADASRPQRGAGGGGGAARGTPPTEEQLAEMRKRAEETAAKVAGVLTADQNARLKQIQLWQQGTRALTANADLAKELALTDEQKSALKTITDESDKKRRELGGGGRNASAEERTAAREKATALQKETDTECLAVLTAGQKTKFDTLKGPEFKLDMTAAFGNRGNRRGGNNNN